MWGNCSKTLSNKLQKLQNRAARILTFSSFDANADTLGWNSQRQMHRAIMVYKSLNGLALNTLEINLLIVIISLRDGSLFMVGGGTEEKCFSWQTFC